MELYNEKLPIEMIYSIFDKANISSLINLAKTNTKYRNIVYAYLSEKYGDLFLLNDSIERSSPKKVKQIDAQEAKQTNTQKGIFDTIRDFIFGASVPSKPANEINRNNYLSLFYKFVNDGIIKQTLSNEYIIGLLKNKPIIYSAFKSNLMSLLERSKNGEIVFPVQDFELLEEDFNPTRYSIFG